MYVQLLELREVKQPCVFCVTRKVYFCLTLTWSVVTGVVWGLFLNDTVKEYIKIHDKDYMDYVFLLCLIIIYLISGIFRQLIQAYPYASLTPLLLLALFQGAFLGTIATSLNLWEIPVGVSILTGSWLLMTLLSMQVCRLIIYIVLTDN